MNETADKYRVQSAMVFMALEQCIARFVVDNAVYEPKASDGIVKKISERVVIPTTLDQTELIKFLCQNAYFDELFSLARLITEVRDNDHPLLVLEKLGKDLGAYKIRNAFAHPNHPFLESYWFRVAAIASDPSVQKLGFSGVEAALRQALAGTLAEIPEEWLFKGAFVIPNNVPNNVSHEITGLLGRNQERTALKKDIRAKKFPLLAVVAPGGIGKTALVLDLLDELKSDPEAGTAYSAIVFLSAKQEKLTSSGITAVQGIKTFSEVHNQIREALVAIGLVDPADSELPLEECVRESVLLCLDNLETLVRDEPESFSKFYDEIPDQWKVIVTSRVSVDGAKTHTLHELDQRDALILARRYAKATGAIFLESHAQYFEEHAVKNPLAVRLIVDALNKGSDIAESGTKTHEDIVDFSYSALVETLSLEALLVLESLLISEDANRLTLIELTGLDADRLAAGMGEVIRTSLVYTRAVDDEQVWSLAEGVRDLILTHIRNLEIREKVHARKIQLETKSKEAVLDQKNYGISQFHWAYLPEDSSNIAQSVLGSLRRRIIKRNFGAKVARWALQELSRNEGHLGQLSSFHAYKAHVLSEVQDYERAIEHCNKALSLSDNSPRYQYQLAHIQFSSSNFKECERLTKAMIESGYENSVETDAIFSSGICAFYFLSKIFAGKYADVFAETQDWQKANFNAEMRGTFRASALKRDAERKKPTEKMHAFSRVVGILQECIDRIGMNKDIASVCTQLIRELSHSSMTECDDLDLKELKKVLGFLKSNLPEIFEYDGGRYRALSVGVSKLSGHDIADNPFAEAGRENSVGENGTQYLAVRIYHIPEAKPGYAYSPFIFACNEDGDQYYLSISDFRGGSEQEWGRLRQGDIVYVIPYKESIDEGKAIPVREIVLVDEDTVSS